MLALQKRVLEAEFDPQAIAETAGRAIRFAQETGTPLTPEAFHVWYVYALRRNDAINQSLDRVMNTGARLTPASLAEIYHAHISGRSVSDQLAAFGDTLSGAMSEVAGAVSQGLEDATLAGSELRLVKRSLGLNATRHELLIAVGSLMKSNQSQIDNARKLESQLDRSKTKVVALEKELAEVRKNASTDLLTKLLNRRRFDLLLGEAIFNAHQRRAALTLAIADIDSFGPLNEKWGHETGDNVLRFFAQNLTANLKGKDIIARFGGEQFAILFADVSLQDSHLICEKLRRSFAEISWSSQQTGGEIGTITASFGVALLQPADTRESFVARAERQLLEAKRAGKNQTHSA